MTESVSLIRMAGEEGVVGDAERKMGVIGQGGRGGGEGGTGGELQGPGRGRHASSSPARQILSSYPGR